ncbi:MAG: phosphodiester glycosidase family protein [Oscillospiraceae bacterium]|nr:phosphodiester glycosidase family protein [Oscillospiraceae bacterium]
MSKRRPMRTGLSLLLVLILMVNLIIPSVSAKGIAGTPEGRYKISSTEYAIVDGVTETKLTTNNAQGNNQRIGYIVDIDAGDFAAGNIRIAASYMNYSFAEWGLQSVTDQARLYERVPAHDGYKVVAAINADFFNMTNGEPAGVLVMDGQVGHAVNNRPYFAILDDGTAEIRRGDVPLDEHVLQAVGGNEILVENGENVINSDEAYAQATVSRTAIGIRKDGSVVMYVTHGSTPPTSCGETYFDIADVLVAQGCWIGLNLDGGGSSTLATVREGTNELVVQNSPSDGVPRTVSSTLFVVSTVQSDGVFDHASLTPNNEFYTPSLPAADENGSAVYTTVQFEAQGVDKSGTSAELPETGLSWRLAAGSEDMGDIDENTGLFTAAVGAIGEVGVELLHNGNVVGSTVIQIAEPDQVYFESVALSLDFSQVTDLGLTIRSKGVDLNIKDGDFTWELKNTKNDEPLGSVSNNKFTAHEKMEESLEGTITATYNGNSELTASINVEIGKMPVIALDFEDPDFKAGLYDWGAAASFFTDGTAEVYKPQTGDGNFYHLRRQVWNGSSWSNPSDSYWVHENVTTTQPWTEIDGDEAHVTMNEGYDHGYNQFGYTTDAVYETGVKLDTYGQHGQIWVVSGPAAGKAAEELVSGDERYSWFVYTNGVTFTGNYNAAIPASGVLKADGYGIYAYHASAIPSTSHNQENMNGYGSGAVTKENGQVRFGNQALKLTYDFRTFVPSGSTKNANINYRVTEALVAPGSPTGFGMWFYAPEDMSNFWLWCEVAYWNGSAYANQTLHFTPAGAEKSCQYTGINWTGWKYVEANLTSLYEKAVVDAEHPIMIRPGGQGMIMMTYIPGGTNDGNGNAIVCGSKSIGEFYVDNVRWVYGTNVDDMDYPEILSVNAGDTELSTEESVTVNSNDISFDIRFTDPLGENYSGIDAEGTQLFLDGSPLTPGTDFTANADQAQTVAMTLANGEHTLRVSITDNFGNVTDQTYYFVVSNPAGDLPTIIIDRDEEAELGGDYNITISVGNVMDWTKIKSISTNITYKNTGKLETVKKTTSSDVNIFYDDYLEKVKSNGDGTWTDSQGQIITDSNDLMKPGAGTFGVASAVQKLGANLTGLVRNRKADDNTRVFYVNNASVNSLIAMSDLTILSFNLPIPSNLAASDYVPYNVTVAVETTNGQTYYVNTGDQRADLWAYYEIEPEVLVSNRENSVIVVNTTPNAGANATVDTENVKLFDGETDMNGTFSDGNSYTTPYFSGKAAGNNFSIQVRNAAARHYSFASSVNLVEWSGEKNEYKAYDLTMNPSAGNNSTEQNITWLSSLESSGEAKVQYVTKADYDSAYKAAYDEAYDGIYSELKEAWDKAYNEAFDSAKEALEKSVYDEAYKTAYDAAIEGAEDISNPTEEEIAAAKAAGEQAGNEAVSAQSEEILAKAEAQAIEVAGEDTSAEAANAAADKIAVEAAFNNANIAEGKAKLYSFELGFKGAFINRVDLKNLEAGTAYVLRAGDGTDGGWSAVTEFATYNDDGTTSFVVVGDAQLHGNGNAEDQAAIETLMNIGSKIPDVDFGIQTGDYVDGGTNFAQWSQILGVWQDAFPGIDFIKAMGNHETNNANGSNISAAIYGLEGEGLYYSVEYGNVYIAVINQHANLIDAASWLVEDAAKSDATWKVLVEHQPPYYTNPLGSSDGHHNILAPACDEAGIDFVFSGHDHSYARTEQIYGETALDMKINGDHYVDANGNIVATKGLGTVYMISGDLGEKSRENSYAVQNPNNYPFAKTAQDYDSLYITVDADERHFTVTAWNMRDSGEAIVWDTFTVYSGAGVCDDLGEHYIPDDGTVKYDPETGMLLCDRCGEQIDPAEIGYSGFAENVNGADEYGDYQYYFLAGKLQTGTYSGTNGKRWFPFENIFLYADENGLLDHNVKNWGDATCIKDGKNRAYSPRYDASYAGGAAQFTGHHYVLQEDGSLVCDNTYFDSHGNEQLCGNVAIDVADWDFHLGYKAVTYDGATHLWTVHVVNPENGEELTIRFDGVTNEMTDFRRLWSNNRYVGTASVDVYFPSSGDMPTGNYYNSNGTVTLTLEIRPDNPTNITATANDDRSVTLNWTHALAKKSVGCKLDYQIYCSADGGKTWKNVGTTAETSYTVSDLNARSDYQFRIRSRGVVGEKTYNAITYTTPVSATSSAGKALTEDFITRTWTKTVYSGESKTYSADSLKLVDPEGYELVKDTDYTVTYANNVNAGTANVTVTGIGNYEGTLEFTFEIAPQSLSGATAKANGDAAYDPNGAKVGFTVTDQNGLVLTEGKDYTVSYKNNTSAGKGTATITGIGNYEGVLTASFTILPEEVKEEDNLMLGDMDLDKKITAADARLALRQAVNLEKYSPDSQNFRNGDVNFSGTITAEDARLILRAAVNLENPDDWLAKRPK